MSSVEQNVQVIQQPYEAFGRGDVPGVLACVDEDATWINPYGQGRFPGQWIPASAKKTGERFPVAFDL